MAKKQWSQANCMGYALNKNRWMKIPNWENRTTLDIALWLEKQFNLKMVNRSQMVLGKEYIVFRRSQQDFHFMRRSKEGHWRHKPGGNYVRPISEKEVFASQWVSNPWLYYNSTPYIFEVQT